MNKTQGIKITVLAADLIDEQLRTLPLAIAAIMQAPPDVTLHTPQLPQRLRLVHTASGGNLVAEASAPATGHAYLLNAATRQACVQNLLGNALLAVESFLKAHDMDTVRTPEIQFLGHLTNAILNNNTFTLPAGYMPTASFDGLVIDARLHGAPLFGTPEQRGFIEFGDVLALLGWLSRYLRGEMNYSSGGDAG